MFATASTFLVLFAIFILKTTFANVKPCQLFNFRITNVQMQIVNTLSCNSIM